MKENKRMQRKQNEAIVPVDTRRGKHVNTGGEKVVYKVQVRET